MPNTIKNFIRLNFVMGLILLLITLTRPLYPEKYKDKLPPVWLGIIILLFIFSFGVYFNFRYKDKRRTKKFDITFKEMEKYKLVKMDNATLLTWSAIFAFLYGIYGYYNNINHIIVKDTSF